jgi:hypothetical protein
LSSLNGIAVKRNAIHEWLPNFLGHIFLPVNRKLGMPEKHWQKICRKE